MSKKIISMISELKKSTLGDYIKKASHDVATRGAMVRQLSNDAHKAKDENDFTKARELDKKATRVFDKSWARRKRMAGAVDRLTKEDLDSMTPEGIDALIENIEQLDELSRKTLALYTAKAAADTRNKTSTAKDLDAEHKYYRDNATGSGVESHMKKVAADLKSSSKKADDKAQKRLSGVFKAAARLATNTRVTKEDIESLDELSKSTLGSYVKKAEKSSAKLNKTVERADAKYDDLSGKIGMARERRAMAAQKGKGSGRIQSNAEVKLYAKQDANQAEKYAALAKIDKRKLGLKKANDRLTQEEVIDELSTDLLARYKKKAGEQASAADKQGDFKKGNKRFSGIMKATRKQFDNDAKNESVEAIEELSKDTLKSYVKKADKDFNKAEKAANKASAKYASLSDRIGLARERRVMAAQKGKGSGRIQSDSETRLHGQQSAVSKERQAAVHRGTKRIYGMIKANARLTKEEVEALDELSKKTLGSYYAKASVDSYDHSRKALDAFSDGDKEKDDFHFKKMNQREIGKMKAVSKGKLTTNEDINEACKVGDTVTVQTSTGSKTGRVNDITKTHIGVKHDGVKGIVHYHPEYVKKVVKEEIDDALVEGVSWERWDRSHKGVKGMSKSNRGGWMVSKHSSGYRYGHKEGEDHITVNGTGKDAAKAGSEWAKKQGISTAYILETFVEPKTENQFTLGSIAASALTTNRPE
jgi:hypothetical protein